MARTIVLAVLLGVIGLVVGYLIFARVPVTNELYPLKTLFQTPERGADGTPAERLGNELEDLARGVAGITAARQNTLISGGVGVLLGVIIGVAGRRRR